MVVFYSLRNGKRVISCLFWIWMTEWRCLASRFVNVQTEKWRIMCSKNLDLVQCGEKQLWHIESRCATKLTVKKPRNKFGLNDNTRIFLGIFLRWTNSIETEIFRIVFHPFLTFRTTNYEWNDWIFKIDQASMAWNGTKNKVMRCDANEFRDKI